MKIPHVLKIDRETVRIVYGNPTRESKNEFGDLDGLFDPKKRLITLNANLRRDTAVREQAFFHEVVHAFDWIFSLDLKHGQVDRLGKALAYFFNDNGVMFASKDR